MNASNFDAAIDFSEEEQEYYSSIQEAINSGVAWRLEGFYGRAMMDAIQSGACMLGKEGAQDYYGSYIPSRDEVEEGSKGSYGFVANAYGDEWAERMAALGAKSDIWI